jgi:hypothetical protein
MPDDISLSLNEHARDAALISNMADIQTTQTIVLAIYGKLFDLTAEQVDKKYRDIRERHMTEIWALLGQQGDLDIPGLREALGL